MKCYDYKLKNKWPKKSESRISLRELAYPLVQWTEFYTIALTCRNRHVRRWRKPSRR